MRWTLWLALGIAVGGSLWLLFGQESAPQERLAPAPEEDAPDAPDAPAWMRLKSGTLTLDVRGGDGQVPVGAQVGFKTSRGPRLYYVDPTGLRTLTDVPLGDVMIVAQAPGYESLERPTRVEAGVPGELKLNLVP